MEDREVVGFFEVLVSEPQDVDGQEKTPKLFALRRFGLRVPVAYTVYRIISVAPWPLVGSFTTESPARINLLITSQQTGILWLGFGYPPTSL
jgi:hypothetical protein